MKLFYSIFGSKTAIVFLVLIIGASEIKGQDLQGERMRLLENRLNSLALTVPGLNQKVQLSVSGASAQEFLRALAQSNHLNINVDPNINFKVVNNFTDETALNVLIFLAKEYMLDVETIGSILSIKSAPVLRKVHPIRDLKIHYNTQARTLSLELNNDSLGSVAKKITQLTGKNIVIPVPYLARLVSAFFSDAPFDVAIEKLAYANNLKLTRTTDGVYILQGLGENEEVYINEDKTTGVHRILKMASSGGPSSSSAFSLLAKSSPRGKLLSVDATGASIVELVRASSQEAGINYFIYSDIKGNITTHVNDIPFNAFLSSMFQGTDYTYKIEGGIYLIGDRRLEGLRTNKVIQLQYRAVDTVQAMIPTEWRRGVEIKEFKEQNTLLLSGSSPQITEIENYIKQLDKRVPMVLIEVTLLDVRKGKSVSTGIRAGVSDSVKSGGTVLPGIDYTFGAKSINDFLTKLGKNNSVNLGRVTPNFYVGLSALEANNNAEVRQVPKLSTLNGHTAKLSIGSTKYYSTKTQNVIGSLTSQTVVTEQYTPVNADLKIDIRPIVSGDDEVTLNIGIDISDFIGNPPLNAPPPTSTSKFESIIRARNEDMIVLGGLERTENSESGSGVPLLARIPVLKWFFSSREKSTSKVVTIVFIKPIISY